MNFPMRKTSMLVSGLIPILGSSSPCFLPSTTTTRSKVLESDDDLNSADGQTAANQVGWRVLT